MTDDCTLCRCGHDEHLHDREAIPALCMACGTAEFCRNDHDHTVRCRQCGRDDCCDHCAAVFTFGDKRFGGNHSRWAMRPIFPLDADVTIYWPDVRPCYEDGAR